MSEGEIQALTSNELIQRLGFHHGLAPLLPEDFAYLEQHTSRIHGMPRAEVEAGIAEIQSRFSGAAALRPDEDPYQMRLMPQKLRERMEGTAAEKP